MADQKVNLLGVQKVLTHIATPDCCQIGMWALHCQIIDKKSRIWGRFSLLNENCPTMWTTFFLAVINTPMAITLCTIICVQ